MEDKYYRTIDLGFAAYLCCKGFNLLGAVDYPTESHPNQKAFILEDQPDRRQELEERFRTGRGDEVSASYYSKQIRMVNRKAKNAIPKDQLK